MDEITVLAPATVANVVCGFDCLGFALGSPYDEMTLRRSADRGVRISHFDDYGLSTDPAHNVAGVALTAFIEAAGLDHGFELEITKRIKPGSGIGSSAASGSGAVVAANEMIGRPFSPPDLIELAMAGEQLASGSRHADNLAPCILGGFTLVRSTEPLDIVELKFPELWVSVIHPQIEIKTAEARAMLPHEVPLNDAVGAWSNLGAFVAAMATGDIDLMHRAMVDTIVEPARQRLIPNFDEVRAASLASGAIGGGISGSGPSIFALSRDAATARTVEAAMRGIYRSTDIIFKTYVSRISRTGVRPI